MCWAIPRAANNILQWQNGGKAIVEGLEGALLILIVADTLDWRTNATYMIKSEKSKIPVIRCRVIPKYTINTACWTGSRSTASFRRTSTGRCTAV